MLVLRKTMDAAVAEERQRATANIAALACRYGGALERTEALQREMSAWVMNKADNITPAQAADLFYAQDDRWQATFFNVMQERVLAHHDALPPETVWGKCPGVPAGEGQWWHMAQHLTDQGFETLEAMYEHARSARGADEPFLASVDTLPKGGDGEAGSVRSKGSAVPAEERADAPNTSEGPSS